MKLVITCPNLAFIKNFKRNNNIDSSRLKRDYSNYNKENFIENLSKENLLESVSTSNDVNIKYEIFRDRFIKTFEKHVSLKKMSRIKEKRQQKPCITNAIRKSILIKNKYYKKFIKSNVEIKLEIEIEINVEIKLLI